MRLNWVWASAAIGMLIASGPIAGEAHDMLPRAGAAVTTTQTSVPFGWVDFCSRYAGECEGGPLPRADITLTIKVQHDLEQVTRAVNADIQPETDMDHWGVVDRWDLPTDGRGDCEDYALLKRKMLIDAGYPRQALLMTVVKDHEGEGHAVLTVKTDRGEFVLDNMSDTVAAWDASGYRFIKRQSQEDQNVWVSIGTPAPAPAYTAQQ